MGEFAKGVSEILEFKFRGVITNRKPTFVRLVLTNYNAGNTRGNSMQFDKQHFISNRDGHFL